jgi:hypothetical protein
MNIILPIYPDMDLFYHNIHMEETHHMYICCSWDSAIPSSPCTHHKSDSAMYNHPVQPHPSRKNTSKWCRICYTRIPREDPLALPSHTRRADRGIFQAPFFSVFLPFLYFLWHIMKVYGERYQ